VFNWSVYSSSALKTRPFSWARVEETFRPEVARLLSDQFPDKGLNETLNGDSSCEHIRRRTIVTEGRIKTGGPTLPEAWSELMAVLISDRYVRAVEELAGRSLKGTLLNARICSQASGCPIPPHTDLPNRVVTQIIYLTPDWRSSWRGEIDILRSADPEDVAESLAPRFNSSVLIVRSDNSYHSVRRVSDLAAPRRSLLLKFLKS
jgi:SM-20-related protein